MMTKKKIQALIDDLMDNQDFYRGEIYSIVKNAEKSGHIIHKYDDAVFLYKPGYEPVGISTQSSFYLARGIIEGLQLAIDELKNEL